MNATPPADAPPAPPSNATDAAYAKKAAEARGSSETNEKLPKGNWDRVIDFMTEDAKRLGRANGGGFYEYPDNGRKYLWPELKTYFPLSMALYIL